MPNETSLGYEARCTILHCDNLITTTTTINDVQTSTLEVSGITQTNGISNTGTISTTTLSAANVNSAYINEVSNTTTALASGASISVNPFTSTYNNYHCVLTLELANTPSAYGSIFLNLTDASNNNINQFVYQASYLTGSTASTTTNAYYPFLLGWVNDLASYRESGEWVYAFDIYNTQVTGRAAVIKSYNLTYSNQNVPGTLTTGTIGNLINDGYAYGYGATPGTFGTSYDAPYKGLTISFGTGFSTSGSAILSISGFN